MRPCCARIGLEIPGQSAGGGMETTSARALAVLVGDLATDRPPRYAALAMRIRRLVADGRVPLGTRLPAERELATALAVDRKSTRLNSSHANISYAVFCLKK